MMEGKSIQQFYSNVWGLVLLRGIILIIFGWLLLAKPGITLLLLVQFLGVYFFVDGIFNIFRSIQARKFVRGWGWGIFTGILEILLGILIFSQPLISTIITVKFLVYWTAFMAIVLGISGIITGILAYQNVKHEWAMIIGGILAIIFGVILIINPQAVVVVYLTIMGILAIVGGILEIFASFRLRKIGKIEA
jgi:uncharacterized membrane protein HdeD (DUF308 family)